MKIPFVIILIISSAFNLLFAQENLVREKINISAGFGFPELLNAAVRYQFKQTQTGIGLGFLPIKDGALFAFSGDFYYHFAGHSRFSARRPFYGRLGLQYHQEAVENPMIITCIPFCE